MSGRIFALMLGSLVLIGIGAEPGLSRWTQLACIAVGALGFGYVVVRIHRGDP